MNLTLAMNEADGFAIAMIAILGLSFSFVAMILVGIIRQARKSNSEADELIDEVQNNEEVLPAGDQKEADTSEAWEKKADWWKGKP